MTTPCRVQFRLRLRYGDRIAIGPGKVSLLEAIAATGSISAAARRDGMSYRRAWLLIDEMNQSFRGPVVATTTGGSAGGGTQLTQLGQDIVQRYRRIEALAHEAAGADLAALQSMLVAPLIP